MDRLTRSGRISHLGYSAFELEQEIGRPLVEAYKAGPSTTTDALGGRYGEARIWPRAAVTHRARSFAGGLRLADRLV
jgi:hypothetical protein